MNIFRVSNNEAEAGAIVEPWGRIRFLASRAMGNAGDITFGRVTIHRGEQNPRHAHMKSEEVIHVLAGRIEHTVGDERIILGPGDTLTIPAGVFHNAISVGEVDAEMIVAFPTGERDFVPESH